MMCHYDVLSIFGHSKGHTRVLEVGLHTWIHIHTTHASNDIVHFMHTKRTWCSMHTNRNLFQRGGKFGGFVTLAGVAKKISVGGLQNEYELRLV